MTDVDVRHCDRCPASSDEVERFRWEAGICNECYLKEYRETNERKPVTEDSKARAKERRDENYSRIVAIKLSLGCADCGYNEYACALQFDHIPELGEKLFTISDGMGRSWESIEAEIAKCEVVCATHHAVRTFQRKVAG